MIPQAWTSRLALLALPLFLTACMSTSAPQAEAPIDASSLEDRGSVEGAGSEDPEEAPPEPATPEPSLPAPVEPEVDGEPSTGDDDDPEDPPPAADTPAERSPSPPHPPPFDVDAFVRGLPDESIGFNVPASMQIDETVRIRLLIQPGAAGEELVAQFTTSRRDDETGELVQDVAPVGEEMGARLASSGLEVTALTPESQLLSLTEPTEWRWDIEATEGGLHRLELSLYAIAPGRSSGRTIRTYEREMLVEVTMRAWAAGVVSAHWEWLWTLLLAPVGAWLWRRRRASARAR